MRYIPHTDEDVREMLARCGISKTKDLFKSIPESARMKKGLNLPSPLSEPELIKHIKEIGLKNLPAGTNLSFLGAGSYQHHIPAAVTEIISRSEWVTPYTPYQPEISQGTLQAIFEYQSMICNLTGMDVANASHYDGAAATAEAALLAINKTKRKRIVIASTLHPEYRDTIKTLIAPKHESIDTIPFEKDGGISLSALKELLAGDVACVVIQSPNFFGVIENLEEISAAIKGSGALFIVAIAEPISLGLLEGPGAFGADIVTAEGQAFGGGLNFGGPYLGIFAASEKYLRSIPGRIVGTTADQDGKRGFVLTISTREQHIRREKATSNICSNEALMATTAAIYLSLMGKEGLKKVAEINLGNAEYLKAELLKKDGASLPFNGPTFNEFVIKIGKDVRALNRLLISKGIFAGVPLEAWYPELKNHLLVCTTECHTKEDIDNLVTSLRA